MRILEIPPRMRSPEGDSSGVTTTTHGQIMDAIESCIHQVELLSPESLQPELSVALRSSFIRLSALPPPPDNVKVRIWKLSYRLWNACVDLANTAGTGHPSISFHEEHAKLRQIAADLLTSTGSITGIPSANLKAASFLHKTGMLWHGLKRFDLASACFDRAANLASNFESAAGEEESRFLLDLNVSRAANAFDSPSGRVLALASLGRSKKLVSGDAQKHRLLADQYLSFGKQLLSGDERSDVEESIKLLNEALDLSERGLKIAKSEEDASALRNLRAKSLRFMAAGHLQKEEYENVLKCVMAMSGAADDHPSLGFLALKAYLGLRRYGDAEGELMKMSANCRVPAEVCLSAVEVYMKEAAAIGAHGAKAVFMGLVERCAVSPAAAVRVVDRVLSGGSYDGTVRSMAAAELASEERVVGLFKESAAAKDRAVMHAILWNQGASLFHCKDYRTSSVMFEKSMLYIPYDAEGRHLRAKSFRVLCLCYLGLVQCDRAQEYINEADKLEPNIVSAFLKFKVILERKDDDGAISQIQSMVKCMDFEPEFLTLAAHEAIACKALRVAVFALSELLDRSAIIGGGSIGTADSSDVLPMQEAAIQRNILALLLCLPEEIDRLLDVLKQLRRARDRMIELGVDRFFAKKKKEVTSTSMGHRELKWFAVTAWNMGLKAGKEGHFDMATEFLELAAEFYDAMINNQKEDGDAVRTESQEMVCKALILSVSSALNAEKKNNVLMEDSDVRKALALLEKAGKILSTSADEAAAWHKRSVESSMESKFVFLYAFSNYELLGRTKGPSSQVQSIQSYINTKSCTLQHLLQLGLNAVESTHPNSEAAQLALTACLKTVLASPSPDYQMVALVLRKRIEVSIGHRGISAEAAEDEAMEIYRQAYRILVGLKGGEYPIQEAKWLSTTAWNRSGMHVRLGHLCAALKWMKMGLELAKVVPEMEAYTVSMRQCLAKWEKVECASAEGEGA